MGYERKLIFFFIFIGCLLMLPNGMTARFQRPVLFSIMLLFTMGVYISCRIDVPLGLLISYISVSAIFHPAYDVEYMSWIVACTFIFLITVFISKRIGTRLIYDAIMGVVIANVVFMAWQYIYKTDISTIGFLSNTNETTALMAIGLVTFFDGWRRYLAFIPLLGWWVGVSFGGVAAACIAGMAWLTQSKIGWKKIVFAMAIILAISLVYADHKRFSWESQKQTRLNYWTDYVIPSSEVRGLFGWGGGQFKWVMPMIHTPVLFPQGSRIQMYQNIGHKRSYEEALKKVSGNDAKFFETKKADVIYAEAHNEYLEVFFNHGAVGLGLLVASIMSLFIKGKGIAKWGFLISCIGAIWFFVWQIAPLAVITTIYGGIICSEHS